MTLPSATETLSAHRLTKTALENLRPLLQKASKGLMELAAKGQVRNKEPEQLWIHEWYDDDVLAHISPLISGIESLEQSRHFIEFFPRPRANEKKGVSQHTWIEYHYAHYLITLVSLFDISLALTNSVFRLGNRDRDCKRDLIIRNTWVAHTSVVAALKKLDELIQPHREGRNLHVHRGEVPKIASVMDSDLLDKLALFSFVQLVGKPVVERRRLELGYKSQITSICARLSQEIEQVRDCISELFNALLPVYEQTSESLHENWRILCRQELERRRSQKINS